MSPLNPFFRFRVSLTFKFIFAVSLLVSLTSLAFGWFTLGRAMAPLQNQLQDQVKWIVRSLGLHVEHALRQRDPSLLEQAVQLIVENENIVECSFVNPAGETVAYAGRKGNLQEGQHVEDHQQLFHGKDGEFLGTLRLKFSYHTLTREMNDLRRDIFFLSVGVIGMGILFTLILTRILLRPIEKLVAATERVGKGELAMTVDIESQDEIGDLAHAFNHMTLQLKESRDNLEKKVEERTRQLEENIQELNQARMSTLRMLENLEAAKRELEKVNRELKEMDETKLKFIGTASHELKTPLTAIKANIDFILSEKGGNVPKELKLYLHTSQRNTNRLHGAMDHLLDLTRIKSGRLSLSPEPITLSQVVEGYVHEIKPVDKYLTVRLDIPKTLRVLADRNGLHDIFINLLSNAFKFTADRGEISISANEEKGSVVLQVRDTGIGIAEDQHERIFQEFYQVEGEKYGGTGLGLAIVKRLVEEHGGKIWVKSHVGKGATFFLTLPAPT